jgi:hypothetical protein
VKRPHAILQSPRVLIALSLLALGTGLASLAWLGTVPPPVQTRRLPDGSILELQGATYGTGEAVRGSGWQKVLYALLPPARKHQARVTVLRGERPGQVTFHFRTDRPGTAPRHSLGLLYASVFDEHGCEVSSWRWEEQHPTEQLSFPVFPRRARTVGLRLYKLKGVRWTLLAEFRVSNPRPGPYPIWSPPPLPLSQPMGEDPGGGRPAVTLTELTANREENLGFGMWPGKVYWRAIFRVTRDGKPTRDWTLSALTFTDPTGNTWEPGAQDYSQRGDEIHANFSAPLWADETAWKLKAEFSRTGSAAFGPDELWTVRDLPVPRRGKVIPLRRRAFVQGVPLEVVSIAGAYAEDEWFPGLSPSPYPWVGIRRPDPMPPNAYWTIVRLTDQEGRELKWKPAASIGSPKRMEELLAVHILPGTRRINLTLAVHKGRTVEFLTGRTVLGVGGVPGPAAR